VNEDRIKWNKRYAGGRESILHATLSCFCHLAPVGRALDIACGTGETSIYLAKKGFSVDAIDISDVAIRRARRKARRNHIRVNFKSVDAEKFSYGIDRYSLITSFYFLNKKLFPKMERALKSGGVLILETFNRKHRTINPEFNPLYLLERNELLRKFKTLEVLYYCEVSNITTYVARKP